MAVEWCWLLCFAQVAEAGGLEMYELLEGELYLETPAELL